MNLSQKKVAFIQVTFFCDKYFLIVSYFIHYYYTIIEYRLKYIHYRCINLFFYIYLYMRYSGNNIIVILEI